MTTEQTSPIRKFTFVITTPQYAEMLAFYRDLLGIPVIEEWSDFGHGSVLEPMPGTLIELIDMPDAPAPEASQRPTFMGVESVDMEATYDRMVAAGARVSGPPAERPWGGRAFTVFDPDGMPVNVYAAAEPTG